MNLITAIAQMNLLPIWRREIDVWGRRLKAPSLDRLVCLVLHRWGLMGKADRAFFERTITPGMTVIDIGANQGLYTLLFSHLVGDTGTVIAFEPEPDMFASLERNCAANRTLNVECCRQAVGARKGAAVLSRSLIHGGDGRMTSGSHAYSLSRSVDVQVVSLDEAIGDRPVDFIKIDVQGWELEVFRGMGLTTRRNPTLRIYFEYWPYGLQKAGADPSGLLHTVTSQGFHIFADYGNRELLPADFAAFRRSIPGLRGTNLLALR